MKKESFKKIFAWVIVFTFILNTFPASSSSAGEIADSVYINGNIYTMDEEQPNAAAIAVKGQELIFVGSNEDVKSHIGNNTKITDLKGKTVIPGLVRGHIGNYKFNDEQIYNEMKDSYNKGYQLATHATSDKTMAEDRIGAERMKGAYAWRKVIESGNIIFGGYAGESMTREEDLKGSLKAGKLADFVIIDRDYMKCPANEIKDIQALTTVLGGETVSYTEGSFELSMAKGDVTLHLTVAKVGDQELVPIRDVLEGFEYGLVWNNQSKSISID